MHPLTHNYLIGLQVPVILRTGTTLHGLLAGNMATVKVTQQPQASS